MPESLLSPSGIKLFGREFPGFSTANLPTALGANHFLLDQINATGAKFARIYAFSYEGNFYTLPKPAIFLVHGDGEAIAGAGLSGRGVADGGLTDQSGLVAKSFGFERSGGFTPPPPGITSEAEGVRCWAYDKGDFSLRLDVTTGTFEDILLEAEIEAQARVSSAGRVQISGAGRMQVSHAGRMQVAHRSRE